MPKSWLKIHVNIIPAKESGTTIGKRIAAWKMFVPLIFVFKSNAKNRDNNIKSGKKTRV